MTTFADDFNRANGPVGNGWTVGGFQTQIVNQMVQSGSQGRIFREEAGLGASQSVVVNTTYTDAQHRAASPCVKMGATWGDRYQAQVGVPGSAGSCSILRITGGGSVVIGSAVHTIPAADRIDLQLIYDAGQLSLLVDGVVKATATDNQLDANTRFGLYLPSLGFYADALVCTDVPTQTFDAEPEPFVEEAIPQEVTFTGTDTAWEPGTPGQPIFQVDKGTLDSQTVTSATSASAMYTPPQATDTATFTDPSTGLTDQVALSTGFQVNGGELSEEAVSLLDRTGLLAAPDWLSLLLNYAGAIAGFTPWIDLATAVIDLYKMMRTTSGEPPAQAPDRSQLDTLWWILNGHGVVDEDHNVFEYSNTAAVESTNAVLALSAIRTGNLLTLQSILDAIGDIPAPDLSAILDELAAIRTGADLTLQDPIDAAEAVRGSGLPTIKSVLDAIAAVRSLHNYSLETVVDDIAALVLTEATHYINVAAALNSIRTIDLPAIRDDISDVRGADSVDLTQLHDQTGQLSIDMVSHFGHVDTAISGVRGLDARDLTEVFDAIAALPQTQVDLSPVLTAVSNLSTQLTNTRSDILAAIAGIRPADYPLWPGEANVTLGEPVQGVGNFTVSGPCDGVVMTIDAAPRDILKWSSGGIDSYAWAGYLAFVSDRGDAEAFQFVNLSKRVAVPLHMLQADSVVVHLRAGVQATVTPWTVDV